MVVFWLKAPLSDRKTKWSTVGPCVPRRRYREDMMSWACSLSLWVVIMRQRRADSSGYAGVIWEVSQKWQSAPRWQSVPEKTGFPSPFPFVLLLKSRVRIPLERFLPTTTEVRWRRCLSSSTVLGLCAGTIIDFVGRNTQKTQLFRSPMRETFCWVPMAGERWSCVCTWGHSVHRVFGCSLGPRKIKTTIFVIKKI